MYLIALEKRRDRRRRVSGYETGKNVWGGMTAQIII
jgi:hypothetical protein